METEYEFRWVGKQTGYGRSWGTGNCNQNTLHEIKSILNKKAHELERGKWFRNEEERKGRNWRD